VNGATPAKLAPKRNALEPAARQRAADKKRKRQMDRNRQAETASAVLSKGG